jgi:tRNA-2-methylthio-N6-dimethylallyladenosine synthase
MTPGTFVIRTFGCQMNERDTEIMAALLRRRGLADAAGLDDAQVALINTCHVREHAEHRALSLLGRLREWREARPDRVLVLTGCVAQAQGRAVLARFPQVDVVLGPARLAELPSLVERAWEGERPLVAVGYEGASDVPELSGEHPASFKAWIKIMEGCDHACAFCVVPAVRGPERHRPFEEIVAEAESLAARGVVEVTLLGQTVNAYGKRFGPDRDFAALLRRLAAVPGLRRVRFTSPHPSYHHERVLRAIAECEAVCPHLHLPVQSGSDRILKAMRRGYDAARFLDIVDRARTLAPGLAVTTDLIVGFPGEAEADFVATLELVERAELDGAFAFKYSARPGTPAAGLPDAVPEPEKDARLARLNALLERLGRARNEALVGTEGEVLVEGPAPRGDRWQGRLPSNKIVAFVPDAATRPGAFRRVRIEGAGSWTLDGSLAPASAV